MKNVLKVLGIGSLVTGGLTMGFNLGMLIGYIKDADLSESKLQDIPPFPV
jgi:hypothetical protein